MQKLVERKGGCHVARWQESVNITSQQPKAGRLPEGGAPKRFFFKFISVTLSILIASLIPLPVIGGKPPPGRGIVGKTGVPRLFRRSYQWILQKSPIQ